MNSDPHTDPGYLSLRALAVYSGLSIKSLRSYLADPVNPLPHYRMRPDGTGKILVSRLAFDAWMVRFQATPQADVVGTIVDDVMAELGL